ncbi:MAG: hypothetical protein RLZZ50_1503 [Verrucomicrobiota bacterium]
MTMLKSILTVLLFVSASVAFAHGESSKIPGPNRGRVLVQVEPHAEFFVTAERKVRLTFVDDHGKPVAPPAGVNATLITGARSAPVTMLFVTEGEGAGASLLSITPLPAGENLPAILRVQTAAAAAPTTVRFQINLARCGECDRAEYACVCAH